MTQPAPIAITMGDPAGVGPETVVKALDTQLPGPVIVIGDFGRLQAARRICRTKRPILAVTQPGEDVAEGAVSCLDLQNVDPELPFGKVAREGGQAAYEYIAEAVRLAMAGQVAGITTAPINKEALQSAGHIYPGHTELLAHLSETEEVSMLLTAPGLRVIHVTTHIGLLDAIERIEPERVERTIRRGVAFLERGGLDAPRVGVCGINPHAGENGLFGRGEEDEKIVPALRRLIADGLKVEGPLPADTLFFRARRGDFDLVVAMYHDQGHGPVKVLGLEAGVNVTVGLPFVRTSVDHGTAFDIAGTGVADERSLVEAIEQAFRYAPSATIQEKMQPAE